MKFEISQIGSKYQIKIETYGNMFSFHCYADNLQMATDIAAEISGVALAYYSTLKTKEQQ